MDPIGGGVFASHEGVYLWYDSASQALLFPDGGWWDMFVQSAALEDDAGSLYPTAMHDGRVTLQWPWRKTTTGNPGFRRASTSSGSTSNLAKETPNPHFTTFCTDPKTLTLLELALPMYHVDRYVFPEIIPARSQHRPSLRTLAS